MKQGYIVCFFLILLLFGCKNQTSKPLDVIHASVNPNPVHTGMVVTAHPEATRIGVKILEQNGNAIDAAVATGFALAVCYPKAGNIGGGGFMTIRLHNGDTAFLDFREQAPQSATEKMFLDSLGEVIEDASLLTRMASGVPGSVDGLLTAFKRFGSLPFDSLIQPAINLAHNGFRITEMQADDLNAFKKYFVRNNLTPPVFIKKNGWKAGDTLIQQELAETLMLIKLYGRKGFYDGITAQRIVNEMKKGNGIINIQDLKEYKSIWRKPLTGGYKNYTIIAPPLPSSGGIALLQLLKITEKYPVKQWGRNSVQTTHTLVEAERRIFADRAKYLGDIDFVKVPVKQLLDEEYIMQRFNDFDLQQATPSDEVFPGEPFGYESNETTHYSIVDRWNNAVSTTTTLNRAYGSRIVVQGAGFLLNNEMDDFSVKPGKPNSYGLVGDSANAIAPKKRMLSSMTPTIVLKNDSLFMVVGTPGGPTIITSVFQTILNVTEFGMSMQEAVEAKRFHHQWKPDKIFYEYGALDNKQRRQLKTMGHKLKALKKIGRVDAIKIEQNGTPASGADIRGDDSAGVAKK